MFLIISSLIIVYIEMNLSISQIFKFKSIEHCRVLTYCSEKYSQSCNGPNKNRASVFQNMQNLLFTGLICLLYKKQFKVRARLFLLLHKTQNQARASPTTAPNIASFFSFLSFVHWHKGKSCQSRTSYYGKKIMFVFLVISYGLKVCVCECVCVCVKRERRG